MNRYFIFLNYDGTAYHGWQRQENSFTVQQVVESAFSTILRENIEITGAGRTDTGVHAKYYAAHFDLSRSLTGKEISDYIYHLNSMLPEDIAISTIKAVKADAHARFSAISRTYRYYISLKKAPFFEKYSWVISGEHDIDLMNQACATLMEYNDFSSFAKLHSNTKTNFCTITHAGWENLKDRLVFTITADRFLRNMVRAIVGTMIDIGRHKLSIEELRNVILSKDRSEAGYSVPAKGLFLENIEYPSDIFLQ